MSNTKQTNQVGLKAEVSTQKTFDKSGNGLIKGYDIALSRDKQN